MDLPVKQVLKKLDTSSRLVKWTMELAEYEILYEPQGPIKAQALADFVAELTIPQSIDDIHKTNKGSKERWLISVDGTQIKGEAVLESS